jgi:hypothetical protein
VLLLRQPESSADLSVGDPLRCIFGAVPRA